MFCTSRAANYFDDFQWLGNCSNPEELFERSTVNKSELIKCMRPYNYFNQLPSNLKTPEVNLPTEYISYLDRRQFGRCYTIRMTDPNISSYRMNFYETVKIYFHSLGTMKSSYPRVYMRIKPDQRMTVALGYDVFDFLSTTEEPCEENIDYSEDDCIDKLVHRDSMKEIGCTTPWGKNKSTICTSSSKAKMAADLYNKYFWMGTTCPNPCKFLKVRASVLYSNQDPERNTSALYINLDNKISYYESYFTYLPLSLIAEIGGYVGLFLGISFNQFHELVDFLKSKIFKILRN